MSRASRSRRPRCSRRSARCSGSTGPWPRTQGAQTLLTELQGKGAPPKALGARVQGRGVAVPDGWPPRCRLRGRLHARRAAPPPRARRRDGVQGQGRAVPRRSAGTLGHRVGARYSPPPSLPRTYIAPDGAPLRLSKNLLSGLPRAHGEAIALLKESYNHFHNLTCSTRRNARASCTRRRGTCRLCRLAS